jgi:hypothetical protein
LPDGAATVLRADPNTRPAFASPAGRPRQPTDGTDQRSCPLWTNTPVNASAALSTATSPVTTSSPSFDRLAVDRGCAAVLRCDNGPELACAAMADWAGERTGLFTSGTSGRRRCRSRTRSCRETAEWLVHYEIWLMTGEWYGGGDWPPGRPECRAWGRPRSRRPDGLPVGPTRLRRRAIRSREGRSRIWELHKRLHTRRILRLVQVDPKGKAPRAGLLQSPLTDSNRRPPPYHGGIGLRRWHGGGALAALLSLQLRRLRDFVTSSSKTLEPPRRTSNLSP